MSGISFDLGLAIQSDYDTDGFPEVQVDLYGGENAGAPMFEHHHTFGHDSRPLDPEKDANARPTSNSCTALYGWEGSRGHSWLGSDPRVTPKLPKLAKGSGRVYCASAHYVVCDEGEDAIRIVHASGTSIRVDASGVTVKSPTVTLGDGASGVATEATLTALLQSLQQLGASLTAFAQAAAIVPLSAGTSAGVAAAATALATVASLPANFSQTVKAAP